MTKFLLLLPLALLLSACAWNKPQTAVLVTEGFHTELPAKGTRAVFVDFWSTNRSPVGYSPDLDGMLQDYVAAWLRHVGIVLIVPVQDRGPLLEEQRFRLLQDDARLRIGQMHGASLFIDLQIGSRWEDPVVTVKATSVETGEIVWSGSAKARACVWGERDPAQLRRLADHALATAFGFEQSGTHVVQVAKGCGR